MRGRVLRATAASLAVFAAVLGARALRLRPAPPGGPPAAPPADVDASAAAAHLQAAIRFRTVSHQDPAQDDPATFDGLRAFLAATFPRTHEALAPERVSGHALLYTWKGSDPALAPIVLMAHGDVVPVEAGTEAAWTHPPFDGEIVGGFVWGRGAMDDKGSLLSILEAVESLLARGYRPKRTVLLSFGFDEEVGGADGALAVAARLKQQHVRASWVLDEGGAVSQGVLAGVERAVAGISVTEKGYLSVELLAHGEGGHSSMPPLATTIGRLAAAVSRLEAQPLPARLAEPVRTAMQTLGAEMAWPQRLALANLWLTAPLVASHLAGNPRTAPLVRTTTAPTIFEAGIKENVLPSQARAVVNFRLLPGDSTAGLLAQVKSMVADDAIEIRALTRTIAEPSPVSRTDGPGFRTIAAATRRAFPDAVVVPLMVNGATDSRHLVPVADDVYRFVPRLVYREDLKRVHGTDERIGVIDLARQIGVYREIVEAGASD